MLTLRSYGGNRHLHMTLFFAFPVYGGAFYCVLAGLIPIIKTTEYSDNEAPSIGSISAISPNGALLWETIETKGTSRFIRII